MAEDAPKIAQDVKEQAESLIVRESLLMMLIGNKKRNQNLNLVTI